MLTMSLEGLFVVDITAFADPLHSAVEARKQMLDLMPEVFAAYLVVMDQAVAVNPTAVAAEQAVIEFVTSSAAVVVVIAVAGLDSVTNQEHSAAFVAAVEPWVAVTYVQGVDQSACLSSPTEFQAAVAAAAAVILKHYFVGPTVDDAYLRGFAEPLTAAAAAVAAVVAAASLEDYSAGQATSAAAACLQHCFAGQSTDSAACLQCLVVVPLAAAVAVAVMALLTAVALVFAVDEYPQFVAVVAAA